MRTFKLIALFVILISVSCRKVTYPTDTYTPPGNPTSYLLISQQYTSPGSNGMAYFFYYNSQHLITKMEQHNWAAVIIGSNAEQLVYDTAYYSFEYTNGLCSKMSVTDNGIAGYYLYSYNADKLPVQRKSYSSNQLMAIDYYTYDQSHNMTGITDSAFGQFVGHIYSFTYNSDNNMISATDFSPAYQLTIKYEWTAFDKKINFIKAVNGLPPTYIWDNNLNSYSSSSPNNILNENCYFSTPVGQPPPAPVVIPFTHSYNDEGLPLTTNYAGWNVTSVYMKYR